MIKKKFFKKYNYKKIFLKQRKKMVIRKNKFKGLNVYEQNLFKTFLNKLKKTIKIKKSLKFANKLNYNNKKNLKLFNYVR